MNKNPSTMTEDVDTDQLQKECSSFDWNTPILAVAAVGGRTEIADKIDDIIAADHELFMFFYELQNCTVHCIVISGRVSSLW